MWILILAFIVSLIFVFLLLYAVAVTGNDYFRMFLVLVYILFTVYGVADLMLRFVFGIPGGY